MYAQVLVFLPIKVKTSHFLDYTIPEGMTGTIRTGVLVVVPVRERLLPGIVMGLTNTPSVPDTRPIHSVLDTEPVLTPKLLDLARWLSRTTLAPLHKCVQTMLPPRMRPQAYLRFTALTLTIPEGLPAPAEKLLRLLVEEGTLTNTQVAGALKHLDWQRARRYLERKQYIKTERLLRMPAIRPKTVQLARLVYPREQWAGKMERLKRADLYQAILGFLEGEPEPVEVTVVCAETGANAAHLKMLEKRGLIAFNSETVIRDPLAEMIYTPDEPPSLTPGQAAVWYEIEVQLAPHVMSRPPVLLLGVTGSGKTEIYMRAAAMVLSQGKQILILVPEISLTPQTVRRFALRFPGQVGVWHSGMSEGERFDTWRRAREGQLSIVVGARSALFMPFPNLGLVVLDEEEDSSYKQNQQPYYHAREVAEERTRQTGAQFILGSATPTLDAYSRALGGRYRLLEMPQRVLGHRQRIADWQQYLHLSDTRYQLAADGKEAAIIALPPVQIVDLRAELKTGNRSIFSIPLQSAVDHALAHQEQVIFFLNRRGSATHVFCRDCAWVATCPRCDIPLTYHAGAGSLICHHCNYQSAMPRQCPTCGSTRVRAFGLGTEGLEAHTRERWPNARLLRWDRDVAKSHAAHTAIMGRFARGDADILMGTQMIARGLDLPKVTVVGIISADTGLHMPDFRAAERTFQLLAQVAGRAGRGLLGGRVVLQTYHPDHYAVQYAAAHDYLGFARRELAFRRDTGYPPAIRLARLVYRHSKQYKAQQAAENLAAALHAQLAAAGLPATDLIGPAPAFFARIRRQYRWQILLRSVDPATFLREIDIPPDWTVDIDPVDVL